VDCVESSKGRKKPRIGLPGEEKDHICEVECSEYSKPSPNIQHNISQPVKGPVTDFSRESQAAADVTRTQERRKRPLISRCGLPRGA